MSQSDYIEYKKRSIELKEQTKLSPVLQQSEYCAFIQFSLENTVLNTSPTYNELVPANNKMIFNSIYSKTASCSSFICGLGTQNRPNRIPMGKAYFEPLQPGKYMKTSKTVCSNCNMDTRLKQINNANTNFTLNKLNRLKNTICNCTA